MKIETIEKFGHVQPRFILDENGYNATRAEFRMKHDIRLPTFEELNQVHWGREDLRVLSLLFEALIYTKKHGVHHFKFEPGFFTDLASVPKFFRSVVDNDQRELIVPALIHDSLFACWRKWKHENKSWLGFRSTNTLFYNLIRYYGGSRWLAFKCWLAVSTPIGKKRFKSKTRPVWAMECVSYEYIKPKK